MPTALQCYSCHTTHGDVQDDSCPDCNESGNIATWHWGRQ